MNQLFSLSDSFIFLKIFDLFLIIERVYSIHIVLCFVFSFNNSVHVSTYNST